MPKAHTPTNQTEQVDAFMAALDHPFKAEVQAVRDIIKQTHPGITEEVKWKAPSFSYKGYMATFNLWATQHVHLVFHNGAILSNSSGLLEGDYVDRRMVYFTSMDDVAAKRLALENAIQEWVKLMDEQETPDAAQTPAAEPTSDFPPNIGKPAQRALAGAGYTRLEQLAAVSEAELLKLHGVGPKAMRLIRQALAERGWSFAE